MHFSDLNPELNRQTPWSALLPDESATARLGAALAKVLMPGLVVYLEGDLGAGKTTTARQLLRALGHAGPVKSPTYTLVEVYVLSSLYLYHFDFYRFESPEEFLDAGLEEYFRDDSICLVEWPEKAAGFVPAADLRLAIHHDGPGRIATLRADTAKGLPCLKQLQSAWPSADSCGVPVPPSSFR